MGRDESEQPGYLDEFSQNRLDYFGLSQHRLGRVGLSQNRLGCVESN